MKKISADKIRRKFNLSHHYEAAYDLLGEAELSKFLNLLSDIESTLENSISDYALHLTHDLLDDETPQIVRVYWFSKGMMDYYLCVDGTGLIRALDQQMPIDLFDQILLVLDTFYS